MDHNDFNQSINSSLNGIVSNSNLGFSTDAAHFDFILRTIATYPADMGLWADGIDDGYGITVLAQAIFHAANYYVNVAPALQAASESRLFEAMALGSHTLSFLQSSPDLYFDSLYVKADHLARVDLNNVYTILRESTDMSLIQSPEGVLLYKEVFFYTDTLNNDLRVGFSLICSDSSNFYRILYFDSATTDNFYYKLYDFMNVRLYPTNAPVRDPVSGLLDNLRL